MFFNIIVNLNVASIGTVSASNVDGNIVVAWSGAILGVGSTPTFYSQCMTTANAALQYINSCSVNESTCYSSGAGSKTIGPFTAGITYYCRAALNTSSEHSASNDVEVTPTTGMIITLLSEINYECIGNS